MNPLPDAARHGRSILEIADVSIRFGGVVALDGVSFDVERGQICGVIGPNGSGKTTLFNCISRIYRPERGSILFEGRSLLDMPRWSIAVAGIGRTFQNLALFRSMTVRDNIFVGTHSRGRTGFLANVLRVPAVRREDNALARRVGDLITFFELQECEDKVVDELPFAIQKRVELARALAGSPKLLLLDEPAGGLNHGEVEALRALILNIRDRFALTVLLVEHHMNLVMRVSDRVVALDFGQTIADGSPSDIQRHPDVISSYLGAPGRAGAA